MPRWYRPELLSGSAEPDPAGVFMALGPTRRVQQLRQGCMAAASSRRLEVFGGKAPVIREICPTMAIASQFELPRVPFHRHRCQHWSGLCILGVGDLSGWGLPGLLGPWLVCPMGVLCFGCGIIFTIREQELGTAFARCARGRAGLGAGMTLLVWGRGISGCAAVRHL